MPLTTCEMDDFAKNVFKYNMIFFNKKCCLIGKGILLPVVLRGASEVFNDGFRQLAKEISQFVRELENGCFTMF